MATPKEFVEFWLQNSVHPDEQYAPKRGHQAVEELAQALVAAAEDQGFTRQQVETELGGDIVAYIRASIERQNAEEASRLKGER